MLTSHSSRDVVLLSGGMDSCVCAALAARDSHTAAAHVSYGQRTEERERRAFTSICDRLGIRERLIVRNDATPMSLPDLAGKVVELASPGALDRGRELVIEHRSLPRV